MFSRIREHFGTAGLVVAIVALVAALGGGAYAATGGSGGGKATASAKGKQGPRGKTGKTGKTGPAGPAGPQGPAGPVGPAGAKGDAGPAGANGKDGAPGPAGPAGKTGTTGFTATLPAGKTETGAWAFGVVVAGNEGILPNQIIVPISFPIPLATELTGTECAASPPGPECHVHYIDEAGMEVINAFPTPPTTVASASCHGSAAAPTADPGNLCVYGAGGSAVSAGNQIGKASDENGLPGASITGSTLHLQHVNDQGSGWGTWAVTAPED